MADRDTLSSSATIKASRYWRDGIALAALGADQEVLARATAPLEVVATYISAAVSDPNRHDAVGKAIHDDIFGQSRDPTPPTEERRIRGGDLVQTILGLQASVSRMQNFSVMFRRYPWRGTLSRSDHFLSTYYLLSHECYILEERIKSYLNEIEKFAEEMKIQINNDAIRRHIISNHNRLYKYLLKSRGMHVHKAEMQPAEIDRLRLIELLLDGFPHYRLGRVPGRWCSSTVGAARERAP